MNSERATQLCKTCGTTLGVIPMPLARRDLAPCRCCRGTSFIRVIPRDTWPQSQRGAQVASPMAVTLGAAPANLERPLGVLEMYVCRACGYVDWYCNDPQAVPIGPEYMTELVEAQGQPPYR
jgi:hypothetical protein